MNEAQNLNMSLSYGQQNASRNSFRKITLKNVFEAIDKKTISDDLKNKIKEKAKNYPHQALNMFLINLDKTITKENKKDIALNKKDELEFPE
jgi:hypothetical protein